MDIGRKKIVILPIDCIVVTASGKEKAEDITDFRLRLDVLDRIAAYKNISRVIILGVDDVAKLKAIEIFVFIHCFAATLTVDAADEVMPLIPHNIRKKELLLSVGSKSVAKALDCDYISLNDFVCMQ